MSSGDNATDESLFPDLLGVDYRHLMPMPTVENLDLTELLKNQHVKVLYNDYQEAFRQLISNSQTQQTLWKENSRLVAENEKLKAERLTRLPQQDARGDSIAPSDSFSHQLNNRSSNSTPTPSLPQTPDIVQPVNRPPQYPQEILWTLEDCKGDEDVDLSETNNSRPSMDKAIRHEDGRMINSSEWSAIKASARMVKLDLFALPQPQDHTARNAARTKSYFRSWFPKAWNNAMKKMELQQPLLGLCAHHWKADHVLGHSLRSGNSTRFLQDEDSDAGSNHENVEKTSGTKKRSRSGSKSHHARKAKRARGKETGDSAQTETFKTTKELESSFANVQTLQPLVKPIDISFIEVHSSYDNLRRTFVREFPMVPHSTDLLSSMESAPTFANGPPANSVTAFLARIRDADPNSADFSEDDVNASWGHYQFSGGQMTIRSVLTSWNDIGSNNTACQLIAATIKTCKVARHVCFEQDVNPVSFLSDAYLNELVEVLWTLWKDAGGPSATAPTLPTAPTTAASTTSAAPASTPTTLSVPTTPIAPAPLPDATSQALAEIQGRLQQLTRDELKEWIKNHSLPGNKQRTKSDLISVVLSASADQQPSTEHITSIIEERKMKKAGRKA